MIYLDRSVALAYLLAEDRFPLCDLGTAAGVQPASRVRGLESDQLAPTSRFAWRGGSEFDWSSRND